MPKTDEQDPLSRDELIRVTNDAIQTITSPEFMEKMRAAREGVAQDAGLDAAAELLSLRSLRESGVDIPDYFRVTSRIFEDRSDGLKMQVMTAPADSEAVRWSACGGGGSVVFCACGGYSSM